MIIKPLASGSSGNCYYVSDGITNILIEAGITIDKTQEALWNMGKRLADISACLISHEHGDHSSSAQKLAEKGVDIYTSREVITAYSLKGHRIHDIACAENTDYKEARIGETFIAFPFYVIHDVFTLGFVLWSSHTDESLCYVTDTMYMPYSFKDIDYLMIEANYDPEIVVQNIESGRITESHAKRVAKTHMSIDGVLLYLQRMNKKRLKEVWLLHLSNDNADNDFSRRAKKVTGVPVYVA